MAGCCLAAVSEHTPTSLASPVHSGCINRPFRHRWVVKIPAEAAFEYRGVDHRRWHGVPTSVVAVEVIPTDGDPRAERVVRVGLTINPLLVTVAEAFGGVRDGEAILVGRAGLAALWRAAGKGGVSPDRGSGSAVLRELAADGAGPSRARPRGPWTRTALSVTGKGNRWRVALVAEDPGDVGVAPVPLWTDRSAVTCREAVLLIDACRSAGWAVCERGGPSFAALADAAREVPLVEPFPGAPGLCVLHTPGRNPEVIDAAELLRRVDDGMFDDVAAAGVVQRTALAWAAQPRGRPGLRSHQDLTVERWLATPHGLLVASRPGSGKTIAALSSVAAQAATLPSGQELVVVVVCPSGLRRQWVDEASRWLGSAPVRLQVCSYDGAANDPALVAGLDVLVVDEAHVLTGSSRRAAGLRRLAAGAGKVMALTGTPLEHGAERLNQLLTVVFGDSSVDVTRFATSVEALNSAVGPWLVAVGDSEAPQLRHEVRLVEPSADVRKLLDSCAAQVASAWFRLRSCARGGLDAAGRSARKEEARARLSLLDALETARAVAADPVTVAERSGQAAVAVRAAVPDTVEDSRLSGLMGMCVPGTVVFCDSLATGARLVDALNGSGLRTRHVTGSADPARTVAAFDAGDVDVLVVSRAGQRGLNLQRAGVAVHYDIPVGVGVALQRTGRLTRIGSSHATVRSVMYAYAHPLVDVLLEAAGLAEDPWTVAAQIAASVTAPGPDAS